MQTRTNPLDHVKVAAPCPADWERMTGDDRRRFCHQCNLNVYNLSGMTRREAESLVANAEGRLCVRYFRRADGTILTSNCPVGLRALRRRASRVARAALSALLTFLAGVGLHFGLRREPAVMGAMQFEVSQGVMAAPVLFAPEMPHNGPVGSDEEVEIGVVTGELAAESREAVRRSERRQDRNR